MVFARDGLLYTGHISGTVRKWELPLAGSSEDEEQQAAPAAQPQQPSGSGSRAAAGKGAAQS